MSAEPFFDDLQIKINSYEIVCLQVLIISFILVKALLEMARKCMRYIDSKFGSRITIATSKEICDHIHKTYASKHDISIIQLHFHKYCWLLNFVKLLINSIQFLKPVPTCLVLDVWIRNVSSAFRTEFKLDRSGEADHIKNLRFEGRIRRLRNWCMKSTS